MVCTEVMVMYKALYHATDSPILIRLVDMQDGGSSKRNADADADGEQQAKKQKVEEAPAAAGALSNLNALEHTRTLAPCPFHALARHSNDMLGLPSSCPLIASITLNSNLL